MTASSHGRLSIVNFSGRACSLLSFSLQKSSSNPLACNSCGQRWFALGRKDLIQQKAVNDLLLAMNDGAKEGARMAEEAKTFLNGLEDSINDAWQCWVRNGYFPNTSDVGYLKGLPCCNAVHLFYSDRML